MTGYLPQASSVSKLIYAIEPVLQYIPDGDDRNALLGALEQFRISIAPSTIHLEEIFDYMEEYSQRVCHEDAIKILKEAAMDIDLNLVTDSVEYHCDEFISAQQ